MIGGLELMRRPDAPGQPTRGATRPHQKGCVLTIGTFDGLHVGHYALIRRACALATQRGLPALMLTFEPMPREFLQPDDPPARLTNLRERWRLLSGPTVDPGARLDGLWALPFDARLRNYSGAQFLELLRAAGARHLVVGHDFRFGRGAEGSAAWCAEQAGAYGFEVEIVPAVLVDGKRASSGGVREALQADDFARAQRLLGRPYSMRGRVRGGAQLGRALGFPTANLPVQRRRTALAGIFAVRVNGAGVLRHPGVASLGTRPAIDGGGAMLLEVHLFDFAGDLYGHELEVEFVAKLRDERPFASLEALTVQMNEDAAQARRVLESA